jgi:hypothetical protein
MIDGFPLIRLKWRLLLRSARDLKFTANRRLSGKRNAENYPFAIDLIYNFPGNPGFGPLIKEKTSIKGKHSDTVVGCGISRNYSFMNEISLANI